MKVLDKSKIIRFDFPESQYYAEATNKKQVYLHHTVSPNNPQGVENWWKSTPEHVAVSILIARDGIICQLFSSNHWAYHLGLSADIFKKYHLPYISLDRISIGIEILCWGALTKGANGKYYPIKWDSINKTVIPNYRSGYVEDVQLYDEGFRGFYAFERYTDEQIESVRQLLVFWNQKFNIPLDYNDDIWDISTRALSGEAGIYCHTSVRPDKSDCHPQPELINMLKSLKQ